MSRGRKSSNTITSISWKDIFWRNLPTYINILNNYLQDSGFELIEIVDVLDKLSFKIPKGLISKEIKSEGKYPVISQSKEFIIGYSDKAELLVTNDFPLILFGDHSKTLKFVEKPFIIGADGVKLLKPKKTFNPRFFYYFLHGVITDTKDYGRHFSLVRKGIIANLKNLELQGKIVTFLDDLEINNLNKNIVYFDGKIEHEILKIQKNQLQQINIATEFNQQLNLLKQLRQAFLREAIEGKLIKKNNITETSQQLLDKIKSEKKQLIIEKKLKKEKEISPINFNEIPFAIPDHWTWCRLGEVCYTSGRIGWKGLSADEYQKTGPLFLSVHSLNYGDYVDYSKAYHITKERFDESPEIILQNDDILICKDGAGIGKLGIIKNLIEPATINSSLLLIRKNRRLNTKFVYFFFLSSHFQKTVNERIMGATTPHLYQRDIVNFPFALPPVEEQEQIVAKLEELMKFCDDLEKSIKESQDYNEMLLKQVLREAIQPQEIREIISIESRKIENPLKTILAGHIINLNNTTDFGRVKFQKLLFLTEYICKIDFDSHYIKNVAGPYDDVLIKNIEADFNRMRFFNVVQDKTDNKRVRYHALAGASELEDLFLENFTDESVKINNTLLKFRPLSWGECELIATLYAVWNNRIIKNESITDELLYSDFMAWDKKKSKYQSVFYKWLFWMKDERIIPDGWGKYIDRPH